ncbi:hypothetical protein RSAG8_05117, partial [Rhizoctonia solani AG-8 WAC10335]
MRPRGLLMLDRCEYLDSVPSGPPPSFVYLVCYVFPDPTTRILTGFYEKKGPWTMTRCIDPNMFPVLGCAHMLTQPDAFLPQASTFQPVGHVLWTGLLLSLQMAAKYLRKEIEGPSC